MFPVVRRVEDVQDAEKQRHAYTREQTPGEARLRARGRAATHLRKADAESKQHGVERVRLFADESAPPTHFSNKMDIHREMKK